MPRSWLRRAALCALFTLFAQTVHAQAMFAPPPLKASNPRPLTSAALAAAQAQTPDPSQILALAEEGMNGWQLAGLGLMALGAGMLAIYKVEDDAGTENAERWFDWGAGSVVVGAAVFATGFMFQDKGHVWIAKTKGGVAAGKTWKFGGKKTAGR